MDPSKQLLVRSILDFCSERVVLDERGGGALLGRGILREVILPPLFFRTLRASSDLTSSEMRACLPSTSAKFFTQSTKFRRCVLKLGGAPRTLAARSALGKSSNSCKYSPGQVMNSTTIQKGMNVFQIPGDFLMCVYIYIYAIVLN